MYKYWLRCKKRVMNDIDSHFLLILFFPRFSLLHLLSPSTSNFLSFLYSYFFLIFYKLSQFGAYISAILEMAGVNGIRAQSNHGPISKVSNETFSMIESLVELKAIRHLFNQQSTQMETLTTRLQYLTEDMRRLQTNQINDKE